MKLYYSILELVIWFFLRFSVENVQAIPSFIKASAGRVVQAIQIYNFLTAFLHLQTNAETDTKEINLDNVCHNVD